MKTDDKTLQTIQNLYARYKSEIKASEIKPLSSKTYLTHSANFVRWIAGDFVPGAKIKPRIDSTDQISET